MIDITELFTFLSFFLNTNRVVYLIKQVLNKPGETGRFNFSSQVPYYKEELFRPDLSKAQLGKPLVFDMDMSAGDFLSLFYLLKVPVEKIDLKVSII